MTNAEKFKEVFGFDPPENTCLVYESTQACTTVNECKDCTYDDWWQWKYKENDK